MVMLSVKPLSVVILIALLITPLFASCTYAILVVSGLFTSTSVSESVDATRIRGIFPSDVVITPDGTRAYVPCYGSNNVLVIDIGNNQVIDAIDLSGAGPLGMHVYDAGINPDGKKVYLADQFTSKIGVIDTSTSQVAFVDVPEECISEGGKRLGVTPDGKFAYVTLESNRVLVIDVATDTIAKVIILEEGEGIYLVGFSSDSSKAFLVSKSGGGRIYVVDTSTYAIIERIDLGIKRTLQTQASIAISPDDREIYFTSGFNEGWILRPDIGTNRVFIIDLVSKALVDEIEVIGGPNKICLSTDGRIGYVSTASAKKIFVLDMVERTVIGDFDWNGIYGGVLEHRRSDLREIAILPNGRNAYLVGWDADAIFVLNLLDRRVTGVIQLNPMFGAAPAGITMTPDGSKVYVSTWGWFALGAPNGIVVIDTKDNSVLNRILIKEGSEPRRMDITPDGKFLYVASAPVMVVDTATGDVVAKIRLEQPGCVHDVAVIPHQDKLYVSHGDPHARGGIYVVDLLSNTVEKEIDVGWSPTTIVVTPDDSRLYVNRILNTQDEGALVVIDTATDQVIDSIASPISGREQIGTIGSMTCALAVTPDGAHVYWTAGWKWVNVVEVATNKVVKTIDLEAALPGLPIAPSSIAFLPDGSRAYIACWDAGYVVVLDTETWESIAIIRPGFNPQGIAVTLDGRFAYVANQFSEDISVIDTTTNTVVTTIPLAITPTPTPTPKPTPTPAKFMVTDLSVSPTEAEVGQTITISVKVTNMGEQKGSYSVDLKVAGVTVDTKMVTLAGGESTVVTFTIVKEEAGTYDIEVAGSKGTFSVKEIPPPPLPWESYKAIAAVIAVTVVALVAAFLYRRRRP